MKLSNLIMPALASIVLASTALALLPSDASAWKVSAENSVSSLCKDSKAVVEWDFKNTIKTGDPRYALNIVVKDKRTGQTVKRTVKPGQSTSGSFMNSATKINANTVSFDMEWASNGHDAGIRTSEYAATPECKPFIKPTFNTILVCNPVNKKAVFSLRVNQTGGDATLVFNPTNGTKLPNGNPVEVIGTYKDRAGKTQTLKKTTRAVADCTPEVEVPTITANTICTVEGKKAVFTLNAKKTSGEVDVTLSPKNGSILPNGSPVEVTGTYKDNHDKTHRVTATTEATEDCTPPVEAPEIEAYTICEVVDGKAVFTLNTKKVSGDVDVTFSPEDGTVLENGDSVEVTATYKDNHDIEHAIKSNTKVVADCTPEKEIEVCRDGKIISILESEKKDSDTTVCPAEVKAVVTELPNTGVGSVAGLLGATFLGGTGISQLRMRRSARKDS